MEIGFSDATTTTGLVNDQDGQPINADATAAGWHYRRVDLSGFAGKTVSSIALMADTASPAGNWDRYYQDVVIFSADGTLRPRYPNRRVSIPERLR